METTATTKLRTILLVGILSISMLSAGIGSVGAAPAHSSIGSVSVDDRSAAGSTPAPPADPDEWDLRSAKHSDTMSAEIIIDEETVRGITITDDVNHEGRDVSISRDALSGWIEEIPDQVTGVHEDGDRWTSDVQISGDRVIVYVPEFSTQTITFSSRVSITADPADDGASFEYEVANASSVANSELTLTGSDATQSEQRSYQGLSNGSTRNLSIGGTDPANLQINMTSSGVEKGSKKWSYTYSDGITTSPAVSNGDVYVSTKQYSIQQIDPDTGSEIWSYSTNGRIKASPTYNNGTVYVGSNSYDMYAINAEDGSTKWSYSTGGYVKSSATVSDGTVYFGSRDNSLYAIDATTGSKEWSYSTSRNVRSSPTVSDGIVYVGNKDGNLYAIDATTGSEEWSYSTSNSIRSSPTVSDGIVYVGSDDNSLYAIDATTGSEVWSYSTGGSVSSPTVSDGTVYVGSGDNSLYAIDANTGSKEWSYSTGGSVSSPTVSDRTVYIGSGDNSLYAIDATTGSEEWSYSTSNSIASAPTLSDGTLYVGNNDGTLYGIDALGAAVNPSVSIGSEAVSYDGNLTGAMSYEGSLSAITTGSQTLESTTEAGQIDVNVSWTETTETIDPSITISSDAGDQTVDYSGTLSDGSTADLSSEIDNSQIGGNVSVSVAVSESVKSGPSGAVGLDYAHDAQESKQIAYSGEEFSERYSFTHQWPHDRPSAEILIPWASDRVVDVRFVKINGQETTQYSAADGELIVDLGSVQSGDQTNVTAVGSKVSVSGGEISVDDPTTQGEDLDSGISVQSLSSETLEIDVSDSYHVDERDRMIYVPDSSASWSGADPITRIEPGSQTVEIDPTSSSSFRLRSAGVGSSIPSGDAVLRMEDAAEPRVSVSPGRTEGDTLKLTYHDTDSGDYYRVVDSDGNPLDTDQAESPAEFRISDTTGLISIEQFTPEAIVSGISSGAAAVSSGDSLIPPWLALIATLTASVLGLAYASTRTEIGSSMLGRRVIIGGGVVLGYVGAELVTGERLYRIALDALSGGVSGLIGAILSALGAGAGAGSGAISGLVDIGFISLVLGIGLLVGLYAIDQRTGIDIPRAGWGIAAGLISVWVISQLGIGTGVSIGGQQSLSIVLAIGIVLGLLALDQRGILSIPLPLYAGTALLAGVYVLETLAPGSVLGPLQSGLDEVGPLIWLAIIGGALLLLWVWLRSNRPEITIPGLRGGNR